MPAVHIGRCRDHAVELGDDSQAIRTELRIECVGGTGRPEHASTAVQLHQPANGVVIGCETLIGGEHRAARRPGEAVWVGVRPGVIERTAQARVGRLREIEDKRASRLKGVGEELIRGQLVLDVVRAASTRRGHGADDLPVGRRLAIDIHDREEIVRTRVDVPRPHKEVRAAARLVRRRLCSRRTAAYRQEENANQPRHQPALPSLTAPTSTNAMTQGVVVLFRHACRVPFCTTQSPCFRLTVAPSSSSRVISPEMTTP